ncbi:hypothetical protein BDV40DRAFT_259424 [Aspergillus tamarii]|uniref:Uncharacterized protein n=1 Tax=Aspergillus tamarii TaxID=41984 RepID=A0A5N6V1V7_ASPTM|nr:hypothetical protein BDV40DRAFT_259424 [Aspergillus tamarii]
MFTDSFNLFHLRFIAVELHQPSSHLFCAFASVKRAISPWLSSPSLGILSFPALLAFSCMAHLLYSFQGLVCHTWPTLLFID